MPKFNVYGKAFVSVCKVVEAEDADSAIEAAYDTFGGITGFCGNGGSDKLIGVSDSDESIECDGEVEFDVAEEDE